MFAQKQTWSISRLIDIWRGLYTDLALTEIRCRSCHLPHMPEDRGEIFPQINTGICQNCKQNILIWHTPCPLCGRPAPNPAPGPAPDESTIQMADKAKALPCISCLKKPPPWKRLFALGMYNNLLRDLILRVKYQGDRALAHSLGSLLAEKILANSFRAEIILPMPLHIGRLRFRGFNQCQEIARPVSLALNLPINPHLVKRIIKSRPQTGLTRKERLKNLKRAFAASKEVKGKQILIIDDTMTTGASLMGVSEALFAAGALSVEVAVIAITPLE